ncbi:hypothetical protein [Vibrio diazotrophicus]|uniref:hypothetical protein n=1 Tax=Vibrio diazotrophicus TaxID=685 RepID=UPI00142D7F1B|nr:hypothetical protein [Vibrio diazotrophicus]NIY91981.1 hypothetical protein [Vibrio diazotrophicus]
MKTPEQQPLYQKILLFLLNRIITNIKQTVRLIFRSFYRFTLFLFFAIPYVSWWLQFENFGGAIWGLGMIFWLVHTACKYIEQETDNDK